jgi:hypothetical protein
LENLLGLGEFLLFQIELDGSHHFPQILPTNGELRWFRHCSAKRRGGVDPVQEEHPRV